MPNRAGSLIWSKLAWPGQQRRWKIVSPQTSKFDDRVNGRSDTQLAVLGAYGRSSSTAFLWHRSMVPSGIVVLHRSTSLWPRFRQCSGLEVWRLNKYFAVLHQSTMWRRIAILMRGRISRKQALCAARDSVWYARRALERHPKKGPRSCSRGQPEPLGCTIQRSARLAGNCSRTLSTNDPLIRPPRDLPVWRQCPMLSSVRWPGLLTSHHGNTLLYTSCAAISARSPLSGSR